MDMNTAISILGINRTKDMDLRPMVKALSMMSAMNTPEENRRLEAAKFVLRRWSAYQTACNKARDRLFAYKTR